MRRYQIKHNIILACDEAQAQYVQLNDDFYRDNWMLPTITNKVEYRNVQVIQINQEEYETLFEAIETGEEIEFDNNDEPQQQEDEIVDPIEEVTVDFLKEKKIQEMSTICNNIIVAGFDTVLSDNETHHFSLTVQDQLNLITLSAMASAGETLIPYHADGELCKMFSAEDINTIINTATAFKTYHITYFNSLKVYINALESMSDVTAITYGVSIPVEYQSDVLKALLQNGGN